VQLLLQGEAVPAQEASGDFRVDKRRKKRKAGEGGEAAGEGMALPI